MKSFIVASLLVACAVAVPSGGRQQGGRVLEADATTTPKPIVPILKHINQVNDDGSYTFGYEAGDGSFRLETKDTSGKVAGKYGYIDENGQQQVLEYVSGKAAGESTGFQSTGGNLAPFPVVTGKSSPQQKQLDYQYSSVDEDEDGIPDGEQARAAQRRP